MSWFGNGNSEQKKQPWDDIREPLGDLEAARTIRDICKAAAIEAPRPGGLARLRKPPAENPADQSGRAAKAAMELAMKISDPLVRVDGIAGATDLGDGHVVLILDPAVLARQMRERPDRIYAAGGATR